MEVWQNPTQQQQQQTPTASNSGGGGGLNRCHKCLYYVRAVATFLFSHIGLVSLVVGYTIMGAFAFQTLEVEYEQSRKQDMRRRRVELVDDLWNMTRTQLVLLKDNWTAEVSVSLRKFERELILSVRSNGTDEQENQWTFSGAILYSIIVITTIGYGNVAPKTRWGKVVTILYAVIGIPLMLLCMSNIGDTMAQSFKFVYWKVCCYFCVQSKASQRAALTRARSLRYHRYPSVRGRSMGSHHSSTRSAATYQGEGGSEAGSGGSSSFYGQPASEEVVADDDVTRHRRHHHHLRPPPKSPNAPEANKVPIILNRYVLESKEDLRVDLSPSSAAVVAAAPVRRSSSKQQRRAAAGHELEVYELELEQELEELEALEEVLDKEQVTVPIWLCCALVTGYICGGAVLFMFWEKWNFLDASYFCFVTLTTIGFGDLVPGKSVIHDDSQTTLALCALYLLFGMALLAMSFNLVQEQVTSAVKCVGRRIGIIDDDDDQHVDEEE